MRPEIQTVFEVLNDHFPLRDGGKAGKVVCWCGWGTEERLYGFEEWDVVREHVAEMVIEAQNEKMVEVFAKAFEEPSILLDEDEFKQNE